MHLPDSLVIHANLLSPDGRLQEDYALAIKDDTISWVGPSNAVPSEWLEKSLVINDCKGQLITPAFIDCHTHLVYAGNRSEEFKLRLEGASYESIAKQGGGILSTVKATRRASFDELMACSLPRLEQMKSEGTLTVEIKSGYGLNLETEIKMLQVAKAMGELANVRVKTTFLGAHTIPTEYKQNRQAYVDLICEEMLPKVKEEKLADAVDVFCDSIGFSISETQQIFERALELGLPTPGQLSFQPKWALCLASTLNL